MRKLTLEERTALSFSAKEVIPMLENSMLKEEFQEIIDNLKELKNLIEQNKLRIVE